MRYLSEDQVTQMMGIGYLGELRQGPDGNLYQYVQGVDGLGNPIGGLWRKFKRLARRVAPYVRQFVIPGVAPAAVLTSAIPAAPAVAPVVMPTSPANAPAAMPAEAIAPAETATAGWGLGQIGVGPDGNLYQWVQGLDGLGNPIGFWRKTLRRASRQALPRFAPPLPGAAVLTTATAFLQEPGVAGAGGLGALYQAPDGTLYEPVQGLDEDEELRGLDEDEELQGIDEDEDLRGLSEDEELRGLDEDEELQGIDEGEDLRGLSEEEELRGLDADEELQGFAEDEELRGVAEDQDMQGIDGYVRQDGMSGLEAFVPQEPPQTRWHVTPAQALEVWKPLW